MASVKKGYLATPLSLSAWWKHLRDTSRAFWKRNRVAERVEVKRRIGEP
ncbi:hypothetical protein [Brevundimonas sp. TWP2-3-2]